MSLLVFAPKRFKLPIKGGNLRGTMSVVLGESQFVKRVNRKNQRVLNRGGGYTLAVYRRTVGRPQPKEPDKYTKTGKISQRWKNYVEKKNQRGGRPPYKGRGARLQKRSSFQVDLKRGVVVIGPHKLGSTTKTSAASVPALLQDGGPAKIKQSKRFFRVKTKFATHDFLNPVTKVAAPRFLKFMEEIPL